MAFDAFFLSAVLEEVRTRCIGARVEKIHQPARDTIIVHLRCQEGREKLLFAANPAAPRLHLTAASPENPAQPPMFCMLLRKHLYRGRGKLIASALWLIRLSENSLHLISAVIKLFQRWYGKIRRTHEDYFH